MQPQQAQTHFPAFTTSLQPLSQSRRKYEATLRMEGMRGVHIQRVVIASLKIDKCWWKTKLLLNRNQDHFVNIILFLFYLILIIFICTIWSYCVSYTVLPNLVLTNESFLNIEMKSAHHWPSQASEIIISQYPASFFCHQTDDWPVVTKFCGFVDILYMVGLVKWSSLAECDQHKLGNTWPA